MSKSIQMKDSNSEKMYPLPSFPIGFVCMTVNDINPSNWTIGTWELIAQGRTIVGVDTNDSDFNEPKKTGGAKTHTLSTDEMPKHKHDFVRNDGGNANTLAWGTASANTGYISTMGQTVYKTIEMRETGGSQAHNNLQPYFTCYIWCRTA